MPKIIGKKEARWLRHHDLLKEFHDAISKCIKNNICISPECIIDDAKWRIAIEFKDDDGGIKERIESDPKFYYSKQDYEDKVMELYIYYAKD